MAVPPARIVATVVCVLLSAALPAFATNWAGGLAPGSGAQAQSASTPAAPSPVTAACLSSTQKIIKVTWAASSHATMYSVYQSTTSATSGFSRVASGITTTTWTSSNLANGHYWYEVAAVSGFNWLGPQSAATVSTTIANSSPNCSQP